jgi:hypothetical protein
MRGFFVKKLGMPLIAHFGYRRILDSRGTMTNREEPELEMG